MNKKATKLFIDSSYKEQPQIGKFKIDPELTTRRSKVYVNPKGQVVVAHQGSTDKKDWTRYNPSILLGQYKNTNRYKDIQNLQEKVNEKYGKENVQTVSHSQTGKASQILAKKGITAPYQSTTLNPAIIGKKSKGLKVYKSSGDLVSAFTKTDKHDEIIPARTLNPITEHGTAILGGSEFDQDQKRYM
jgi:hypothetical protein